MKFYSYLSTALAALSLSLSAQEQMAYQGRLTDNQGAPLRDASKQITFSIFSSPTGGSALWGPVTINAALVDGRFGVKLGPADSSDRDISSALVGTGTRFMQVEVVSDNGPLPRQQILPAPRALSAERTAILQDGTRYKASVQTRRTIGSSGDDAFQFNGGNSGLLIETGFSEGSGFFLNQNTTAIFSPANGSNFVTSFYDEDDFDSDTAVPTFSVRGGVGGFTTRGSSLINGKLDINGPDTNATSGALTLTNSGHSMFIDSNEIESTGTLFLNMNGNKSIVMGAPTEGSGRVGVNRFPFTNATQHVREADADAEKSFSFPIYIEQADGNDLMYIQRGGSSPGLWIGEGSAFKPGGGSWGNSSDRNLKKNITPLSGSLEKLSKLRPVTFDYLEPEKQGVSGRQTGFIAQEVEHIFPNWVQESSNQSGFAGADGETLESYKILSITGFESLAVNALMELRQEKDRQIAHLISSSGKQITTLQSENADLKTRLAAIEGQLAKLTTMINQLPKEAEKVAASD